MLLCSGLITGEAIVGLAAAVPRYLGWDATVPLLDSSVVSLAALGLVLWFVYRHSTRTPTY